MRGSTGIPGETTKLLSLGDDRVLCLMRRTDGPGLWAVLAQIRTANLRFKVCINTLAIMDRGGEKILKQIAKENDGTYRFVQN